MPGKCSTFGARRPVPRSDGLNSDTRPCEILDPRLRLVESSHLQYTVSHQAVTRDIHLEHVRKTRRQPYKQFDKEEFLCSHRINFREHEMNENTSRQQCIHCGQSILQKISTADVTSTRCQILRLKRPNYFYSTTQTINHDFFRTNSQFREFCWATILFNVFRDFAGRAETLKISKQMHAPV